MLVDKMNVLRIVGEVFIVLWLAWDKCGPLGFSLVRFKNAEANYGNLLVLPIC